MSVDTDARRALYSIAHAPACEPGYGYLWRKNVRRSATESVRTSPYPLGCVFIPDERARPQDPQSKTGSVYVWPDPPATTDPAEYDLIPKVYRPDRAVVAGLRAAPIPDPPVPPVRSQNVAYLEARRRVHPGVRSCCLSAQPRSLTTAGSTRKPLSKR